MRTNMHTHFQWVEDTKWLITAPSKYKDRPLLRKVLGSQNKVHKHFHILISNQLTTIPLFQDYFHKATQCQTTHTILLAGAYTRPRYGGIRATIALCISATYTRAMAGLIHSKSIGGTETSCNGCNYLVMDGCPDTLRITETGGKSGPEVNHFSSSSGPGLD